MSRLYTEPFNSYNSIEQKNNETVNYTLSDNNSHILYPTESDTNNRPNLSTYRKVYSNI